MKRCEFAGWDSEEQFSFGPTPCYANTDILSKPKLQQTVAPSPCMPFIQAPGRGLLAGHSLYVLPSLSSVSVEEDEERYEHGIEVDIDEGVADDGEKNAEETPRLRSIERNLNVLPGEELSITVGCEAK